MKKFASLALLAAATLVPSAAFAEVPQPTETAAAASSSVSVSTGKMLYGSDGNRVATIYRVTTEGNPQVILGGKLITVPASTLTEVDGKVMTSLTKREIGRAN